MAEAYDRAYILSTKMDAREAHRLVDQAVRIIAGMGHDITLDPKMKSGDGGMMPNPDGTISYKIGIKEIIENPNSRLSIREALSPLVACFHEVYGHGGHWRNEANKDIILSKIILTSDVACRNSCEYYGVDENYETPNPRYFTQLHEISAQYMGLKMAQKFLAAAYDEKTADRYLSEYVNLRIALHSEFITAPDTYRMKEHLYGQKPFMLPSEPFADMNAIYGQFQKTFIQQTFPAIEYRVGKESTDYISDYINKQRWPWEKSISRKQFNNISDRLVQNYVAAAVWMKQNPDYHKWMKELPAFKDIDFMNDMPQLIQEPPEHPDEKELDLGALTEEQIDFAKAIEHISSNTGYGQSI